MVTNPLEEFAKELCASINIPELQKWIADGKPYEEDEDIILFKQRVAQRNGISQPKPEGISTDFIFS